MAGNGEKPEQPELEVPVFSVLKKGVTIKNIILNIPSPETSATGGGGDLILVGRHPDCHIVLDHPSISRFHVEVRVDPAVQQITVKDRSSVHGTWVSGSKIIPNVPVGLVEGDTLRLGASTREYRLRWASMSSASEMGAQLDALLEEEEAHQEEDVSYPVLDSQIPSAPPMPESMNPPSSDYEIFSSQLKSESQSFQVPNLQVASAPSMLESMNPSPSTGKFFSPPLGREDQSPTRKESMRESSDLCSEASAHESAGSVLLENGGKGAEKASPCLIRSERKRQSPSPLRPVKTAMSSSLLSRRSKSISFLRIHGENGIGVQKEKSLDFEEDSREETLCRILFNSVDTKEEEEEVCDSDKENITPRPWNNRKSKKSCGLLQDSSLKASSCSDVEEDVLHTVKKNGSVHVFRVLNSNISISENQEMNQREEAFASCKENVTPNTSSGHKLNKSLLGLQRSSSNTLAVTDGKEAIFQPYKDKCTTEVPRDSRSKKSIVASCVKNDRDNDIFPSDQENSTPQDTRYQKSKRSIVGSCVKIDREECDTFPSNKENLTPTVSRAMELKRPLSSSHDRIEKEMIRKRVERVPFQSLFSKSPSRANSSVDNSQNSLNQPNCSQSQSVTESSAKTSREENTTEESFAAKVSGSMKSKKLSSRSHDKADRELIVITNPFGNLVSQALNNPVEEKKRWNIVVDTSCLLNEESRKSLQLLEGLKGTHLIIPRIVIRELDYLKRSESLFRRTTKASSVLQWIERCMVSTSWWIHVQSSFELMPVATTPPISPTSQLGDGDYELGADVSMPFSTCGKFMEIVSPTSEDHILDCALLFKKLKNNCQFIVLTNSVTLRIKAMAEGLLCETPTEFRESLVNPYSKRFLWANSSPRGSTWSCADDAVLTENYCHQHFPGGRMTGKASEGAKGLKLILLHNSHYGKTNSVK